MKKSLLLSLIITLISSITLPAQWEKISTGISGYMMIYNIKAKGDTIYICSRDRGFYISSNNGDIWLNRNTGLPSTTESAGLDFIENNIFLGTNDGVYLSTDFGITWKKKSNGLTFPEIHTLKIVNDNTILVGTESGGVFITTDKGESWTQKSNGLPQCGTVFCNVQCLLVDGNNIFAGTEKGGVYFSTNNGNSWTSKNNGLSGDGLMINYFAKKGNILFAATEGKGVYISTDYGNNWTAKNKGINVAEALKAGCFQIIGDLIFLGTEKYPYLSIDNGESWNLIEGGISNTAYKYTIHEMATNCKYLYATSWGDGVYRLNIECVLGIEGIYFNNSSSIKITPNPSETTTEIQFSLDKPSIVTLSIFNSLGIEVIRLIDNVAVEQNETNRITLEASSLPTGLYFCTLKTDNYIETKKFTIIK